MRYLTLKNMEKATEMIMEKGYDREEANEMAMNCFTMVNKNTCGVEFFIDMIVPKKRLER